MAFLSEQELEAALIEQFASLGYVTTSDDQIGPDGSQPERGAYEDTILAGRLDAAVERLNPHLPEEARRDAVRRVTQTELPELLAELLVLPQDPLLLGLAVGPAVGLLGL